MKKKPVISTCWREMYIKILLEGPADNEEEHHLVVELKNAGYVDADIQPSYSGNAAIAKLIFRGPTTAGREYLDQLQRQVHRESLHYRLLQATKMVASWGVGVVSGIAAATSPYLLAAYFTGSATIPPDGRSNGPSPGCQQIQPTALESPATGTPARE